MIESAVMVAYGRKEQVEVKNAKKIIVTLYYYKSNYDYTRKNLRTAI